MGHDEILYNKTKKQYINLGYKGCDFSCDPTPVMTFIMKMVEEGKWASTDVLKMKEWEPKNSTLIASFYN